MAEKIFSHVRKKRLCSNFFYPLFYKQLNKYALNSTKQKPKNIFFADTNNSEEKHKSFI